MALENRRPTKSFLPEMGDAIRCHCVLHAGQESDIAAKDSSSSDEERERNRRL